MPRGPCATQGFGRLAVRPAQACAETSSRGIVLNEVARRIRCAASSVMRWRNAWRRHDADALKVRFSPGRPRRLTRRQEKRLVRILLRGALANGYRTEVWTTKRVAEVIEKTLHVPCHYNTAGKLLHRLDWTPQKPERRALERDEQASQRRKKKVWPRVRKTPQGWVLT